MLSQKKKSRPLSNEETKWIIASLSLVIIPHLPRLPIWLILYLVFILLFKLTINKKVGILLSITFTIVGIIAVLAEYGRLFGRDAGVALLVIMLYLKLLESKTYRDGFVITGMTYFLVITNFFYTQSIPTAIYMFVIVIIATTNLVTLNLKKEKISIRKRLKLAGKIVIQAVPLMVFLFFLFPRISGSLWGMPADSHSGKTGLSDKISPGLISKLVLSNEVAFRVKFNKQVPEQSQLYWRAMVFWDYDGVTWTNGFPRKQTYEISSPYENFGNSTYYTITAEPHNQKWLYALDLPSPYQSVKGAYIVDNEFVLRSRRPVNNIKQYSLSSYTNYKLSPQKLTDTIFEKALQLPDNNPETRAYANKLISAGYTQTQIIDTVLSSFNQENFIYSLEPPNYGKNFVDEFMFDKRKGFCEHFATSFIFIMRAAGIPARLVAGYQGGETNPLDDYMIVRQADAHAWVELWQADKGWFRVDPTAMVSPTRIERGLDSSLDEALNPRPLFQRRGSSFSKLVFFFDAINHRWNQWVLNYNYKQQEKLMSYFGLKEAKAHHLVLILTILLSATTAILLFYILRHRKFQKADDVYRLYQKFCAKLAKIGLNKADTEGPSDYFNRIRQSKKLKEFNEIKMGEIKTIVKLYIDLRYAGNANQYKFKAFKKKVNTLKLKYDS